MLTSEQRQPLIDKIRRLPAQVAALIQDLSEAQLTTPYLEEEWTVAQNVHHLADSHMNSYIRMKLILSEENPTLKPYNQEIWAEMADAGQIDLQPSLAILTGLHRRWVQVFEALQETDWQRTGLHPEIGQITVEDILHTYAAHGEDHLDQMRRTLAAQRV